MTLQIRWACPECNAGFGGHGKGDCSSQRNVRCEGFICDCDTSGGAGNGHGTTFENPCKAAHCCHCGWDGEFPKKPKGLQAWEKKALDAGWTPSPARARELGMVEEAKS
jgi:hypothetical protein